MLSESSLPDFEPLAPLDRPALRSVRPSMPILRSPRPEAKHEWVARSVRRFSEGHVPGRLCPQVEISPASAVTRRAVTCDGMAAEIVETTGNSKAEYWMKAPVHLLAVCDHGVRRAGETSVEGLPRSDLRDLTGKMSFIPAGHEYREWHEPQGLTRTVFVYFDPAKLPELDVPTPRLLFEDAVLLALALNLRKVVETPMPTDASYLQALGLVLSRELQRLNQAPLQVAVRGGLAAWQQRVVAAYIEEHLTEQITLAELAQLARLSPFHFSRVFKQSFGMPPHRYHVMRRIEQAKPLLAKSAMSVTEIGLAMGFSETSAFTATFRKLTGVTPTAYSRSHAEAPE